METLIERISREVAQGFEACGMDPALGKVTVSNRPDLCEYQCNGAMAAAKQYHKAPLVLAEQVVDVLKDRTIFQEISAVRPGFINIRVSGAFLADYVRSMAAADRHGIKIPDPETIIIDYGGPNVAKPLHVGHLRSAIIGESIKRILRYEGHTVIGDIHLGDWGLQMGLIMAELQDRKPDLVYFDPTYTGDYPEEAPFTISELEEIYPAASARSKTDEAFAARAHEATHLLQQEERGHYALWKHIMNVSVTDLKKNYNRLNVSFDLWKGESDAQPYIPGMVQSLKDKGLAHMSNGALVVDVAEPTDTKEVPPCIILKSDGASLYQTTDISTIVQREEDYHPDRILYVVDKRQEMHFVQVFRTVKKAEIVPQVTDLTFLGFGTMNGRDGKPFKTREGGVMRLEYLIKEINDAVYNRTADSDSLTEEERQSNAATIGLAAIKYGDLSNQASKDYVFDVDRFTSFEGNTGPYILYTIVRIKSILRRFAETGNTEAQDFLIPESPAQKELMLELTRFPEVYASAQAEYAPHRICSYIYDLSDAFNHFYHDTKILSEADKVRQAGYIRMISYTQEILEDCINMLGFSAPEKM